MWRLNCPPLPASRSCSSPTTLPTAPQLLCIWDHLGMALAQFAATKRSGLSNRDGPIFPQIFVCGSCFSVVHSRPPSAADPPLPLCHTTLSHTTLSRTTPSHTTLSHTTLLHTTLSHTTLLHTALSHTILVHTTMSLTTLSRTTLSHTQLFYTQPCHTQLFHIQHCHTQLFHPRPCHARLFHTHTHTHNSFTRNIVTHNSVTNNIVTHTHTTHTQHSCIQHCHTHNSFTHGLVTHNSFAYNFVTHHSHGWWYRALWTPCKNPNPRSFTSVQMLHTHALPFGRVGPGPKRANAERAREEKTEADGNGNKTSEGGEDGSASTNLPPRNLRLPRHAQDPTYLVWGERMKWGPNRELLDEDVRNNKIKRDSVPKCKVVRYSLEGTVVGRPQLGH